MSFAKFRALVCLVLAVSAFLAPAAVTYKLRFTEDFNGKALKKKLWKRIDKAHPDWCKNMSLRSDLVTVKNGILSVRGIRNDGKDPTDTRRVLTGGVMTRDLFTMRYGKVEVRTKFSSDQRGAWPAIWMMPQSSPRGWPNDGEIDIVERLNGDDFVYQTLHRGNGTGRDITNGGRGSFKKGDWNVFGLEWTPDEIAFTVNGSRTHVVKRTSENELEYPWTTPFYLMIDMQLGGAWVGGVDESTLPVSMDIDWVKFYQAYQDGKPLGGFARP